MIKKGCCVSKHGQFNTNNNFNNNRMLQFILCGFSFFELHLLSLIKSMLKWPGLVMYSSKTYHLGVCVDLYFCIQEHQNWSLMIFLSICLPDPPKGLHYLSNVGSSSHYWAIKVLMYRTVYSWYYRSSNNWITCWWFLKINPFFNSNPAIALTRHIKW